MVSPYGRSIIFHQGIGRYDFEEELDAVGKEEKNETSTTILEVLLIVGLSLLVFVFATCLVSSLGRSRRRLGDAFENQDTRQATSSQNAYCSGSCRSFNLGESQSPTPPSSVYTSRGALASTTDARACEV